MYWWGTCAEHAKQLLGPRICLVSAFPKWQWSICCNSSRPLYNMLTTSSRGIMLLIKRIKEESKRWSHIIQAHFQFPVISYGHGQCHRHCKIGMLKWPSAYPISPFSSCSHCWDRSTCGLKRQRSLAGWSMQRPTSHCRSWMSHSRIARLAPPPMRAAIMSSRHTTPQIHWSRHS